MGKTPNPRAPYPSAAPGHTLSTLGCGMGMGMGMTGVVFVHGWGCDARLWDAVCARLPRAWRVQRLDCGYFGAHGARFADVAHIDGIDEIATLAQGEPVLAVGHSVGALWWLSHSGVAWRRLLAINGFPRFTQTEGYAPALAPRVLERMRQQFALDPAAVLAEFHARCGSQVPAGEPDHARLAAGLAALANWDGRATLAARRADVVAIGTKQDPIVPAAMSAMAFADAHLELVDAPGHMLPLTHPELCAAWIERLAA